MITLPAQRGRVLYCYSFFFFLLSSICQHVNISETLCPIMLILDHNNKSANAHFWHDQFGVKGHVGVTGVKSRFSPKMLLEKVYFRSQILVRPSIGEYWNIFRVPVLPENVICTFFRTCWCYSEAYNIGTQKWSSIVQYSCTSIWDLKYTFSKLWV